MNSSLIKVAGFNQAIGFDIKSSQLCVSNSPRHLLVLGAFAAAGAATREEPGRSFFGD